MRHIFSDLSKFRRDPLTFFLERGINAHEPLVKLHVGPSPVYLVTDIDLAKEILRSDETLIDKGRLIYKMREVLGRSSLTISGTAHKERRAAIHKHMVDGLSSHYIPQICATIREFAAQITKKEIIDAPPLMAHLAIRVISTILFGHGALSQADEGAIVSAVHLTEDDLAEEIFRALPHTPWSYIRKKRKLGKARQIMSSVVERVEDLAQDDSLITAFQNLGLQGKDLRDEILLMFLAGHHTTGTAATWLLYHLGTQPKLAHSIAKEASQIVDASGELTPQKIKNAHISRSFAQEVLRLYPSSYWMSREVKRPTSLWGHRLKTGTSLIISPWHLHQDPKYWERPQLFDITRDHNKNPAYIPFGYGGRACVGLAVALLELQLVALEFASTFDIEVVSKVPADPPKPSVTLVPSEVKLRMTPKRAYELHTVCDEKEVALL
ncbi:MAG: cytochrome P450 [Pseudomonadota bacterium]